MHKKLEVPPEPIPTSTVSTDQTARPCPPSCTNRNFSREIRDSRGRLVGYAVDDLEHQEIVAELSEYQRHRAGLQEPSATEFEGSIMTTTVQALRESG